MLNGTMLNGTGVRFNQDNLFRFDRKLNSSLIQ